MSGAGRWSWWPIPKQSIYGWRKADPELVDRVERRYDLPSRTLSRSWRSSPVVLEFVNRLFGEVAVNPVLDALDEGASVARTWGATSSRTSPPIPSGTPPGTSRSRSVPTMEGRAPTGPA